MIELNQELLVISNVDDGIFQRQFDFTGLILKLILDLGVEWAGGHSHDEAILLRLVC